jgi:hypothetical protein
MCVGFGRTATTVLTTLLILQILVLLALVACPALHHALHHDSDSSEHHCAVTMFAQGQVEVPVVEVAPILPVSVFQFLPLTSVPVFNSLAETFPPGRGPPAYPLYS